MPTSPLQMTPGELKFALRVESVLNSLPEPEYRQVVVETLGVLALASRSKNHSTFGNSSIVVEHIINHARMLFLQDQVGGASGRGQGWVEPRTRGKQWCPV